MVLLRLPHHPGTSLFDERAEKIWFFNHYWSSHIGMHWITSLDARDDAPSSECCIVVVWSIMQKEKARCCDTNYWWQGRSWDCSKRTFFAQKFPNRTPRNAMETDQEQPWTMTMMSSRGATSTEVLTVLCTLIDAIISEVF